MGFINKWFNVFKRVEQDHTNFLEGEYRRFDSKREEYFHNNVRAVELFYLMYICSSLALSDVQVYEKEYVKVLEGRISNFLYDNERFCTQVLGVQVVDIISMVFYKKCVYVALSLILWLYEVVSLMDRSNISVPIPLNLSKFYKQYLEDNEEVYLEWKRLVGAVYAEKEGEVALNVLNGFVVKYNVVDVSLIKYLIKKIEENNMSVLCWGVLSMMNWRLCIWSAMNNSTEELVNVLNSNVLSILESVGEGVMYPKVDVSIFTKKYGIDKSKLMLYWQMILCDVIKSGELDDGSHVYVSISQLSNTLNNFIENDYNVYGLAGDLIKHVIEKLYADKIIDIVKYKKKVMVSKWKSLSVPVWCIKIKVYSSLALINEANYKKPLLVAPKDIFYVKEDNFYGNMSPREGYVFNLEESVYSKKMEWSTIPLYTKRSVDIMNYTQQMPYMVRTDLVNVLMSMDNSELDLNDTNKVLKDSNNVATIMCVCDLLIYSLVNKKCYMLVKKDVRGREYITSTLSPVNHKIMRRFLYLNGKRLENGLEYGQHFTNIGVEWNYDVLIKYLLAAKTNKTLNGDTLESIIYKKISWENKLDELYYHNTNKCLYELDATSSVIQMLLCSTKNIDLLYKMGFMESKHYVDPYTYIVGNIEKESVSKLSYNTLVNLPNDKSSIKIKYMYDIDIVLNIISNRKVQKECVMTFLYGSTPLNIADRIINNKKLYKVEEKLNVYLACNYIVERVKSVFEDEFFILKTLSKESLYHEMYWSNEYTKIRNHYVKIKRNIKKTLKLSHPEKEPFEIEVKMFKKTNNVDKHKTNNAFIANLMHFYDAEVMMNVKYMFKKKGLYLIAIHDAFMVEKENVLYLLYSYDTSLLKILKDNKMLENLYKCDKNKDVLKSIEILSERSKKVENVHKINGFFNLKP